MKDSMKDFIQQNKDSFDSFEPSENLWEKIEQKSVKPIRMVSLSSVLRVAAVAVILMGVGLFFLLQETEQPIAEVEAPVEEEQVVPLSLANMSSEMAEVEVYYTTQISERMKELDQYEVDPDMLLEIEFLQNDYEELKKELGQGADRAKIVEAMIENYRLRIEILELILNELKEHKNDEPVYL
jgi:hypothetical protein